MSEVLDSLDDGERAESTCHHGRSSDWLKLECGHGQELVIGGVPRPAARQGRARRGARAAAVTA